MSSRTMPSNMLRTRRKDNNVKPNRRGFRVGRLDRKSSRGMIYENEELRLRTININAEIERGQNDIKKLRRENELLKKEIWCLRDEYEKLDKLLKEKEIDFSSSSTTSETESCSSCQDEAEEQEKPQSVEKTTMKILNQEFNHLSVVVEESAENSDRNSTQNENNDHVIKADQSYPWYDRNHDRQRAPKNFFSPIRIAADVEEKTATVLYPGDHYDIPPVRNENVASSTNVYQNIVLVPRSYNTTNMVDTLEKDSTDLIAKMDNASFQSTSPASMENSVMTVIPPNFSQCNTLGANSRSTFSNGGNLEELLNDIETISKDILALSNRNNENTDANLRFENIPPDTQNDKAYISELNLTLMPHPMPLIAMDKYKEISRSLGTTPNRSMENVTGNNPITSNNEDEQVFFPFPQPSGSLGFQSIKPYTNQNFDGTISECTSPILEKKTFCHSPQISIIEATPSLITEHSDIEKSASNINSLQIETKSEQTCDAETKQETNKSQQSTKETDTDNQTKTLNVTKPKETKKLKMGLRRKVSIHFRGRKDKEKQKKTLEVPQQNKKHSPQTTPLPEKKLLEIPNDKTKTVEKRNDKSDRLSDKQRKSSSTSPERKHVQVKDDKKTPTKKHKKDRSKQRRSTLGNDQRNHRDRSNSACTERSNQYGFGHFLYDDYLLNSERDSMSSCETVKTARKISNASNIPMGGKVPWCGCWGNGCI